MPSMSVPARNRAGGDLREFFIAHQSSLSRAGLKCEPVSGRGIPQFDPEGGSFERVVHAALCATGQPHYFDTKLFEMHGIKGPGLWIEQMFLGAAAAGSSRRKPGRNEVKRCLPHHCEAQMLLRSALPVRGTSVPRHWYVHRFGSGNHRSNPHDPNVHIGTQRTRQSAHRNGRARSRQYC
jgi:hypothetical protein